MTIKRIYVILYYLWTGVEQRAVSRQLIPVIAPLLTGESAQPILLYARAILDFLTLYRLHDGERRGTWN